VVYLTRELREGCEENRTLYPAAYWPRTKGVSHDPTTIYFKSRLLLVINMLEINAYLLYYLMHLLQVYSLQETRLPSPNP
jgi:hypothetical protein